MSLPPFLRYFSSCDTFQAAILRQPHSKDRSATLRVISARRWRTICAQIFHAALMRCGVSFCVRGNMIGLVSPAGAFVGQIKREKHSRDYGESGEMGARLAFSYGHFSRFEKSGRGKLCSASSKPSVKCSLACRRQPIDRYPSANDPALMR